MISAGTEEREILDLLLTDPAIKNTIHREFLEGLIERISKGFVGQINDMTQVIADLEEKNADLQDDVADMRDKLERIAIIVGEVTNG